MEVFRPQNVYADLSSVCIDLQIQNGCLAEIWSVRWQMGFAELVTISEQSNQVFLRP